MKWNCRDTGKNSMQCIFKNDGSVEADICMDVVKVCKGGDHVAAVCTDKMRPGEVDTRVVTGFDPKIKFLEGCMGVEYRRKAINTTYAR